jgi:hypothetical protein
LDARADRVSQLGVVEFRSRNSPARAGRLQRHVTATPHGPFIILFEQDRADEAHDGVFVGDDADHLGPPLDLAAEPLDRIGPVQLGAELVGNVASLCPGRLRIVLSKGGGDESGDDAPTARADMSQRVAREVDAATLPGDLEHLGGGDLDARVSVGHDQLDATQAAAEVSPPQMAESAARPWVKSWEGSSASRHGWLEAG